MRAFMNFVSYTAVYRIYDCWSINPIKYTYSNYASLSAAINDVPYVLDEISYAEGMCLEDIWVEIDYYEDTPFDSYHVDFEDFSWHNTTPRHGWDVRFLLKLFGFTDSRLNSSTS
jgi:hypothetical protein